MKGPMIKMKKTINDLFELFEDCLTDEEMIASDLLAKISNRIIKERLDKQMSQVEFAKYLGVTQAMVSKWESEQYNFTIEALVKIFYKLDLKLDVDFIDMKEKVVQNSTSYTYIENMFKLNYAKSMERENIVSSFANTSGATNTYTRLYH